MQHSVPAASPRVPHPPGEETAGRQAGPTEPGEPWRCPGWGRTVPGASSVQVEVAWEGPGDARVPSPAQSSPFLLSSCPTALPGPGQGSWAWFSCEEWRQAPMVCRRLHSLPKAVAGWIQRGWKCFPRGSRSCPSLPLLSLAWSSSTWRSWPPKEEKPPRVAEDTGLIPATGSLGMALPATSLSANIQWQSLEPALAFPYTPDSEHSSLPAPSPILYFFLHPLDFNTRAPGLFCPQDRWLVTQKGKGEHGMKCREFSPCSQGLWHCTGFAPAGREGRQFHLLQKAHSPSGRAALKRDRTNPQGQHQHHPEHRHHGSRYYRQGAFGIQNFTFLGKR